LVCLNSFDVGVVDLVDVNDKGGAHVHRAVDDKVSRFITSREQS
jgi:hypothetical protein